MKKILIVKKGALGDVVRTSYFAGALKRKHGDKIVIHWLTGASAVPLLQFNPSIDLLSSDVNRLCAERYDTIFSLDDEAEILSEVATLRGLKVVGALLDESGAARYTADSAAWFDMGLLSRFGKDQADQLKKANKLSHSEIFRGIFAVDEVHPEFFGGDEGKLAAAKMSSPDEISVGINPYAGGRWKSKELRESELVLLLQRLLAAADASVPLRIFLFGAGNDYARNVAVERVVGDQRIQTVNTDNSVLQLAGAIGALDLLITSDSFALHLAIAQHVPYIAFFAPTSAAEIDSFGLGEKVVSTSADYCCYKSTADNSSITAGRLVEAARRLNKLVKSSKTRQFLASLC